MEKLVYSTLAVFLVVALAARCFRRAEENAVPHLVPGVAWSPPAETHAPRAPLGSSDHLPAMPANAYEDPDIEVVHGFVLDRGGGARALDTGYEHRQRLLEALDQLRHDVALTEDEHRALLLAIYDYQEQTFALMDDSSRKNDEIYEREVIARFGYEIPSDPQRFAEWRARRQRVTEEALRAGAVHQQAQVQMLEDLGQRLREGLGPRTFSRWVSLCGRQGIECIEGIERSKYDLISIPGRAHLHTCEELDPCYDQRERDAGR